LCKNAQRKSSLYKILFKSILTFSLSGLPEPGSDSRRTLVKPDLYQIRFDLRSLEVSLKASGHYIHSLMDKVFWVIPDYVRALDL
jgi:hypothetical protein